MDFQDGADRIKLEGGHGGPLTNFYNLAREAGLTWDMRWIATEQAGYNDDAVVVDNGEGGSVTIYDVAIHDDLQIEITDDGFFIV